MRTRSPAISKSALIEHPAVDWGNIQRNNAGILGVAVTCERCGATRYVPTKTVTFRLRNGNFRSICGDCSRRTQRTLRTPYHPGVDWSTLSAGEREPVVLVTCPVCHLQRWLGARLVSSKIARGKFTGNCPADRTRRLQRCDT